MVQLSQVTLCLPIGTQGFNCFDFSFHLAVKPWQASSEWSHQFMTCPKKSSYDQHLQKEQKNSITSDILASDASSNVCSKYCFSASKRTVFWFRLSNQQSSLIADFCQNVSRSPITFPDPCTLLTLSHFIFAWIREHFFVVQSSPRVATRTPCQHIFWHLNGLRTF